MNQEMLIGMIENARQGLERTFKAVPDDKLTWKPLDNGRHALDLMGDAAQTPGVMLQILRDGGLSAPPPELFPRLRQERASWGREETLSALDENCQALYAAIRAKSEEELAAPLKLPMGGGMTLPLGGWTMMVYRSFISRFAQINYIQTLYGDFESH